MISKSNDKWLSQILGNYKLTTSMQYRTTPLHEYTIYNHEWIFEPSIRLQRYTPIKITGKNPINIILTFFHYYGCLILKFDLDFVRKDILS